MKFLSNILIKAGLVVEGSTDLYAAAAVVDTDKFVVIDGNTIKYRTGAQVLSDIGGQGALTLTTTGSSGASTLIGSTLNIPTYTLAGLGGVPLTRQITINGTTYDLNSDRSWSVGTVTSIGLTSSTSGVTISSSPITTSGDITLSIATASGSQNGLLSSTDWTTFNNKQNALTNPITGTGAAGQVAYFTGSTTQAGSNSLFWDTTNLRLGIGTNSPSARLHVLGSIITANSTFIYSSIDGNTDGNLYITANAGTANTTSNSIIFRSSLSAAAVTERMRVTALGNLHVGAFTSDSGHKLQVSGTAIVSSFLNVGSDVATAGVIKNLSTDGSLVYAGSSFNNSSLPTRTIIISSVGAYSGLTGGSNLFVGRSAGSSVTSGTSNVFIGKSAGAGITTGGSNVMVVGSDATNLPSSLSNSIHIVGGNGYRSNDASTIPSATHAFIGGGFNTGVAVKDFYFGQMPFTADAGSGFVNIVFYAPSGSGTDIGGSNFTIAAGRGTGTGTPGDLIFRTSTATTTGATVQTLSDRLVIAGGTGLVTISNLSGSGDRIVLANASGALSASVPLSISSPTNGQVLKYDGTNWVNSSDAGVTGSGTAGQVTYWGSSSTITGSNNLFWDATNNRLGINVSNPLASLQIGNGYTDSLYDGFKTTNSPEFLIVSSNANSYHRILGGLYNNASTINLDLALPLTKNLGTNGTGFRITSGVGSGVGTTNGYLAFSSLTGESSETFTATERMRIFASTGNLILNSTTDNGLRFQVTGDGYFSGSVGIGSTALTTSSLRISRNIAGGGTSYGIFQDGVIQSSVSAAEYFYTSASTQATTFTLGVLRHYLATQGTFGAGSTVSNQYGFFVAPSLTGAVNNYAFYGDIALGTGRWNIFMNGTASNYLRGQTSIGDTSVPDPAGAWPRALVIGNNGADKIILGYLGSSTNGATIGANNSAFNSWARLNVAGSDILFRIAETERMRLDASGNLAVGIATASSRLHVDAAAGAAHIRISEAGTTRGFVGGANGISTGRNGYFMVRGEAGLILSGNGNNSDIIINPTTANVQIGGTSDTGQRFQVTGDGFFSGSVGIGTSGLTFSNLRVSKPITSTFTVSNYIDSRVESTQSDAVLVQSTSSTQAAAITVTNIYNFLATQGSFGAGSTVTSQRGFQVAASLVGATNNYGFYGDIPSGTGRWNLYMNGSAANWINGNTKIGGTAGDAGFKFDVDGTMRVSGASTFSATGASISMTTAGDTALWSQVTNAGGILYVGRDNAAGGSFGVANAHVIYGTAARPIVFFTNATERMRLDASGNLGLGTASPLVVAGYTTFAVNNATNGANIDLMTAGTRHASWNNTATETYFGTRSNTPLIITTNATEVAKFYANGNFRVGAASADAGFRLDVSGTMRVTGISSIIGSSTSAYISTIRQTNTTADVSFGLLVTAGTSANDVAFRVQNAAQSTNFFSVLGNGAATFSSTVTASSNITSTDGTSSTVIQTISNAPRIVLIDGRVGGKRFDIGPHPVTSSGNFVIRDATATVNRFTIESTGDITFSNNSTALAFIPSGATVPTNGMYLPAANTLGFSTNTTEDMRLTSSGNLLIATTTDTGEKLQVNGDAKITGKLLLSGSVATAVNGDYSVNFSKTYAQGSAISNTNLYGLVSSTVFDLTNGAYSGSATYNATALFAQASIAGNTGTQSTQPIRAMMAVLVGKSSSAAMNLADFRYIDVKAPDNAGVSGHVIGDIYGLRIAALKGATNYTITNGWGVYQEGTTDNNYFGGKVLVGTATAGSSPVRISGLPTSSAGLSAGDLWNNGGVINIA